MQLSLVAVAVAIAMLAPGGFATPSPKFIEGTGGVPLGGLQGGIILPSSQIYHCWSANPDNTLTVTRLDDCPKTNPTLNGSGSHTICQPSTPGVDINTVILIKIAPSYTCPDGYVPYGPPSPAIK